MTHDTPLPTPVGAKTAVCTAFGILTSAGCSVALRRSRIDARNCSHASFDDTQELNYSAVMRAIVATGYKGFVSQEFVPKGPDPLESLRQAIRICDV